MTAVWIVAGIVFLLVLFSGGKKGDRKTASGGPKRIDRPHVIDPEDYECSACRRRFREDVMVCPYCGARFTGRVTDEEEWDEEEDELEAWDEEEGE